ncbi:MAG: DUF6178 family protein, partial [Thermodesulfobacteriota bacterium]|nr:DUF6178 family protein [Thermodesulfobacteriota bacterium]
VIEWIQHMDMETVVLALKKHVRIYKVTDEEDLGETLEKFPYVTIDYVYFIQFLDEDTQRILYPIFDIVKRNDELLFNTIMEGLIWELDSELEEEAHRWKESRLEEKGFPRFNEVMDIYQYVPSEKIKTLPQKEKKTFMSKQTTISPYYPLVLLEKQMFFSHCLNLIHEPEEQNRIRTELVTLSNKIMMADGADIGKIENIEVALHKVSGYLNIGLQIISKGNVESAVDYLKVYFLQHIFQVGYSETIRLQEKAKKLTMHGWEEKFNEFKYMINSPWIEYLEGTRRKRPLFFCNYERGLEYREFRDMQEIVTVNNALDMIEYLGSLFIERLNFTLDTMRSIWLHNKREEKDLKLSIVLLTAFANMILHGEFVFRPILTSDLERLLDRTFICNNENALPRKIKKEVKEDFLGWLYLQQGDISNKEKTLCHTFVEDSFYALEEEFGYLDIRDGIDPKFLNELFIILPEFTS